MFTLEQVSMLTGLTTRALRNYMKDGFLQGDKSSGKWLFTPEQYMAFTNHPTVTPALQTKKMNIIASFINSHPESCNRVCVILDVRENLVETMHFFLSAVKEIAASDESSEELFQFSSDKLGDDTARFIIRGAENIVLALMEGYKNAEKAWQEANH